MSAFEKYEQMRKAAEAAQQPGATPETPQQRSQRILKESGTRRAMGEILEGMPQQPHHKLIEHPNGNIEAQFGDSPYRFNSVTAITDRLGIVHILGNSSNAVYQELSTDPIETRIASAFINPQEKQVTWASPPPATPPTPTPPTPPPPPEKPKGILGRWLDRREERAAEKRAYYYQESVDKQGR